MDASYPRRVRGRGRSHSPHVSHFARLRVLDVSCLVASVRRSQRGPLRRARVRFRPRAGAALAQQRRSHDCAGGTLQGRGRRCPRTRRTTAVAVGTDERRSVVSRIPVRSPVNSQSRSRLETGALKTELVPAGSVEYAAIMPAGHDAGTDTLPLLLHLHGGAKPPAAHRRHDAGGGTDAWPTRHPPW